MRILIQRVQQASVAIGGTVRSQLGAGLLVLLGVGPEATDADIEYLAGKLG
ncbi:MAG: D-aminoacyl-tRNA deacylase, partial [Alistipes sp.]|nr:D-aminoacyl-tRNA deacylase [Alistipes sp.]